MNFEFEIDQIKTDPDTGVTRITMHYNLGSSPDGDERYFANLEKAIAYNESLMRDWLSQMYNNYVKSCTDVSKKQQHIGYYKESSHLIAMQRCLKGGDIIAGEKRLHLVASYIVSSLNLLEKILPLKDNENYSTEKSRLSAMQQIANQYLQTHKTELSCSN